MGIIIMFLIWYNIWGKNNPKIYRWVSSKSSKLIPICIAVSVLLSFSMTTFFASLIALLIFSAVFALPVFFVWSILKLFGIGKKREQRSDYTYYQKYYESKTPVKGISTTVTGITKSVPKRRKIVDRFDKKYVLNLKDDEIDRIVDASYMSNCWESEISEMDEGYDSIMEWYRSDTGWLRAYLRAFPIKSISSDFEMQHKIVLESFQTIFDQIHPERFTSVDDCIKEINDTFLTFFDETTFMLAYRFLEANNIKYEMPRVGLVRADSVLEQLKKKYDAQAEQGENVTGQKL